MDKGRDLKCIKRRRIIRKGLSLRFHTPLSEGVPLAQSVILPRPVDPREEKRDKERLKVIEELSREHVNPSFGDVIQIVASILRSVKVRRELEKQNDYKRNVSILEKKKQIGEKIFTQNRFQFMMMFF